MSVNIRIRNGMKTDGEGNGGVSEGDIRGNYSDIIESISGVVDVDGGHLLVHQATSPGMNVVVDPGVGYIPNNAFDEDDSDSVKFWEAVVAGATGGRTLTIDSNSSGQPRIDLVCLKIDPGAEPDYYASDVAELIIVKGTPGSGAPATPSYHLKLAQVTVDNGAVSILNAKIADSREQVMIKSAFIHTPDPPDLSGLIDGTDMVDPVITGASLPDLKQVSGLYPIGNSGANKTINWANGDRQKIVISANTELTFSNMVAGQVLTLLIVENSTGNFTIGLPTCLWTEDSDSDLDTSPNAINLLTVFYDGTNFLAQLGAGFA